MARYDRIAPLPSPPREQAFPAWSVLRDLEGDDRDVEVARRTRLRFLALRPVRRLVVRGIDGVPADSFDRQVDGVHEELGQLPARDSERTRIARFLHQIRARTPLAVTTATLDLGEVVEAAGHFHGAEEFYRTALELATLHRLIPEQVVAYRLLGRIRRKRGEWDDAAEAYRNAAELAERLDDPEQWGRSMDGLGHVFRAEGRWDDARVIYRQVLERGRGQDHPRLVSTAFHGLCVVELSAGDFERAVELGWSAFDHARDVDQRSAILGSLGSAFIGLGLYEAAECCYRIVAERAGAPAARAQALLDLVDVAARAGRVDVARERLRNAVGVANRLGLPELLPRADALLAELERVAADEPVPVVPPRSPSDLTRRVAAEIEALGEALVPASG